MKNEIILAVLEDVRQQLSGVSDSFVKCGVDSPNFEDACKVVEARYTITELISSIKFLEKYGFKD